MSTAAIHIGDRLEIENSQLPIQISRAQEAFRHVLQACSSQGHPSIFRPCKFTAGFILAAAAKTGSSLQFAWLLFTKVPKPVNKYEICSSKNLVCCVSLGISIVQTLG